MKFIGLLIIGFCLSLDFLHAQTNFQPGYVIENNWDTLYGEIDYRGDLLMGAICRFKLKGGNEILTYAPGEIHGYRFIDSKYYVTKEYANRLAFLEFLIKGEANIYYLRDENGDHYFIEKEDKGLVELPYEEDIIKTDEKNHLYKSTKHIGLLTVYMNDAPGFQKRIAGLEKPTHNNLIKLANDYHNIVCKTESCIIYEKKLPLVKLSFEPFAGVVRYKEYEDFNMEYGVFFYVWAPRTSEKLYFRTGIIHHNLSINDAKFSVFKIPLQIQYLYPSTRIQPKISFGANMFFVDTDEYKNMSNTICLSGGFNFGISNGIKLSTNISSDFTPLSYGLRDGADFGLVSYSFTAGLYIEL